MNRRRELTKKEEPTLQMTSMIDVVFLLLAFFVVTYKTPEVEGDFNIRMPVEAQSNKAPTLDELTPVTVRLTSDANGELSGIQFGDARLTDLPSLRAAVFRYIVSNDATYRDALAGAATPEFRDDLEIELDCDPQLKYRWVVKTITSVAGYLNSDDQVVKMVDKVKFAPPRR